MTSVEPIFLITTLIKRFKGLNSLGTATGFFLVSEDKVWLVTNKHVLYGDNYGDSCQYQCQQYVSNLDEVFYIHCTVA